MKDSKKTKKIVTMAIVVIAIMVVAVVVLAYNNETLKPSGSSNSLGRWKVEFTSIVEGEKEGAASSRYTPWHTGTYASFYVDFVAPGDSITYDVQISNLGNLDSILSDINVVTNPYKDAIIYEIIDIKEGDKLAAGESKNFKIKVSYELHAEKAVEFNKPISIVFDYKQDTN